MEKTCGNCAYLVEKENSTSCQVINPGQTTPTEKEDRCPKWERISLRTNNNPSKKRQEDIIFYDLVK